jgi:hypothetical protein
MHRYLAKEGIGGGAQRVSAAFGIGGLGRMVMCD